jgi:hypothetical protein
MYGWGDRDTDHGCDAVHDDLYARALYLDHDGQKALVIAYDLLFLGRDESDRIKGAIGTRLDLAPRQILLNCSHTHDGPALGSWGYAAYTHRPDPQYLDDLVAASVTAAIRARDAAREVTLWAGATRSRLPVSRRCPDGAGHIAWAPYPEGEVCDHLPVCLLRDTTGAPVCLLFSVSCHPSTTKSFSISADFPGTATARLARHLGADVAMFLQGCGGDTKACVVADGDGGRGWRSGTWEDVDEAGRLVAEEVIGALDAGLTQVEPLIRTAIQEMQWPLEPPPARAELEELTTNSKRLIRLWATRQLEVLDQGRPRPATVPLLAQYIALADSLRLIALEGEPVAGIGRIIRGHFPQGITFPLGYSNGQGLYLPTEAMLPEGGYEVESAYEYGWPAKLTTGYEAILHRVLDSWAAL